MSGPPQPSPARQQDVTLAIPPSHSLSSSSSSSLATPPPPPPQSSREEFLKCGVPLYQAALEGNWTTAEQILNDSPDWIRKPIGKGGERVLHIAAAAKHIHFVRQLVGRMSADDLSLRNDANNTALCLAATSGVVEIAEVMVGGNVELPNIRGSQDMTPLHMAALLGRRNMVWYLLDVTNDDKLEDRDRLNILTSSIDTELFDFAIQYLNKHPKMAVLRNANQETALHVLARKPLKSGRYHQRSTWKMLTKLGGNLVQRKAPLEQPLEVQLAESLWNEVIKEEEKNISTLIGHPWRLLFVAAKCGNVEFLTTLIRSYPDLIWKVDEENRSIFHIAIMNRHEEIFELIYELGAIKDLIAVDIGENDKSNMLHLAGGLAPSDRLNCVSGAALQMQRELLWFQAVEKVVRPEYAEAKNEDGKTPRALFTKEHEELRAKGEEWMKKTAESCALVASLIATMVFSAAFQLPGGTNGETGAPILVDRPLFMVFAVCNAISLFSSSTSILMFLSILTSRYAEYDFLRSLPLKLMVGLTMLFFSIATMVAAFTATFFLTFRKGVRWIPIPIAVLASVPIALFAFQQFPLLMDIYRSTYGSWSLFQPSQRKLFRNYST